MLPLFAALSQTHQLSAKHRETDKPQHRGADHHRAARDLKNMRAVLREKFVNECHLVYNNDGSVKSVRGQRRFGLDRSAISLSWRFLLLHKTKTRVSS